MDRQLVSIVLFLLQMTKYPISIGNEFQIRKRKYIKFFPLIAEFTEGITSSRLERKLMLWYFLFLQIILYILYNSIHIFSVKEI